MTSGSGHRPVVVGVDFGTLSGRAVVVRVDDGAELGTAVHEYPHGVLDRRAARRRRARCRPTGRCRSRPTTSTCSRDGRAEGAGGAAASPPDDVDRHRHRLHRLHGAAHAGRRHPAVRAARVAPTGRTPTSKLWKHHAAQPQADRINALAHERRRAVDRPLRRADLLGVGVRQGPAAARGGPGGLRGDASAGSRRPTGSSGSCAARTSATPAPPATRGSTRTAATRRGSSSAALNPRFADFVDDKVDQPIGDARRARPAG